MAWAAAGLLGADGQPDAYDRHQAAKQCGKCGDSSRVTDSGNQDAQLANHADWSRRHRDTGCRPPPVSVHRISRSATPMREYRQAYSKIDAQNAHLWNVKNLANDSGPVLPGTSSWIGPVEPVQRGQCGAFPGPPFGLPVAAKRVQ